MQPISPAIIKKKYKNSRKGSIVSSNIMQTDSQNLRSLKTDYQVYMMQLLQVLQKPSGFDGMELSTEAVKIEQESVKDALIITAFNIDLQMKQINNQIK